MAVATQEMELVVRARIDELQAKLKAGEITVQQFEQETKELQQAFTELESHSAKLDKLQDSFVKGKTGASQFATEVQQLTPQIAASQTAIQNIVAKDSGAGGFAAWSNRNANSIRMFGQAAGDFATGAAMGDLRIALLGASNNLQQMATVLMGPVSGALAGIGLGLLPGVVKVFQEFNASLKDNAAGWAAIDTSMQTAVKRTRELLDALLETRAAQDSLNESRMTAAERQQQSSDVSVGAKALGDIMDGSGNLRDDIANQRLRSKFAPKVFEEFFSSDEAKKLGIENKPGRDLDAAIASARKAAAETASEAESRKAQGLVPDLDAVMEANRKLSELTKIRSTLEAEVHGKIFSFLQKALTNARAQEELEGMLSAASAERIRAARKHEEQRRKDEEAARAEFERTEKERRADEERLANLAEQHAEIVKDARSRANQLLKQAIDQAGMTFGEAIARLQEALEAQSNLTAEDRQKILDQIQRENLQGSSQRATGLGKFAESIDAEAKAKADRDKQIAEMQRHETQRTNEILRSILQATREDSKALEGVSRNLNQALRSMGLGDEEIQRLGPGIQQAIADQLNQQQQQERVARAVQQAQAPQTPGERIREQILRERGDLARQAGKSIDDVQLPARRIEEIRREIVDQEMKARETGRLRQEAQRKAAEDAIKEEEQARGRQLTKQEKLQLSRRAFRQAGEKFDQQQQPQVPQELQQVPNIVQQLGAALPAFLQQVVTNEQIIAGQLGSVMGVIQQLAPQLQGVAGLMKPVGRPRGR